MRSRSSESGFSLAELMVAMVVTGIISGAIYGMMMMGQKQFRRDPEVVDRQQNIRMAMDLIVRDVANGGVGMPAFLQTFSPGKNSVGPLDSPMMSDPDPAKARTDEIELISNPNGIDFEPSCTYPGGNSTVLFMRNLGSEVRPGKLVVVFMKDGTWTLRYVTDMGENNSAAGDCTGQTRRAKIGFNPGGDPNDPKLNTSGGLCKPGGVGNAYLSENHSNSNDRCVPQAVGDGEVITYRIGQDTDGVPVLLRLASGSVAGGIYSGVAGQVVARGVEDLQVQYATAAAPDTFVDDAPAVDYLNRDYGTLITKVKITLSARTATRQLVGAVVDDSGAAATSAIRGRLTTTVAIRTNLNHLTTADKEPVPRPVLWQ